MFRKILIAVVSALVSAVALGQVPISGLPNATLPLGNTDQIVVNQVVSPNVFSTRKAPINALNPFFPPITSHYLLQAPDPLLTQSRVLAGTANQVILTDGGALGNLTLSLPQSICVACAPTFSGLTLTGALNGTSAIFSGTLQSNGYTGTTGSFSGALSAGSLSLTTPLPATSGGTGFGSYAIGDLLTASATNALSKLSDVAAGSYLRSGGVSTVPLWSTFTLVNAAPTGSLLAATATNTEGLIAPVAAGSYLRSNGTAAVPIYSTTTIPNTSVLGDLWYGSAANTVSALAGNVSTTKQFLTQTGTGAVSAAPVWGTIAASDLPGTFSGFANPTATVGPTATNGVATTAMRSDAAPAINLTSNYAWTGTHSWTLTSTGTYESIFSNPSTGTAAVTKVTAKNSADSLSLTNTSTGFTGSFLTGGSSGESGNLSTSANIPVNLGVGGSARISMNNAAAGRQADLVGTTNTSAAIAYAGILDQAGVRYGYWGKSATSTTISYESDAAVQLVGNNGVDSIAIDTTHHTAINTTAGVSVTGHFVAFGEVINNGTTCTLNGSVDNYGVTSCTRVSTGIVTLNFPNTTITSYSCTATAVGQNLIAVITARTTTTVNVSTITPGLAQTDSQFSFVCF